MATIDKSSWRRIVSGVPARRKPRVTSVGAFGLSVGWDFAATDGEIVRQLLVFLEDRRALSYSNMREDDRYVTESVLKIRAELTETLRRLTPESGAAKSVRALRDACLDYLDRTQGLPDFTMDSRFINALGELRRIFATYLRILADRYQITVEWPLAALLNDADGDDAEGGAYR